MVVLLVTATLSVYKPWGFIRGRAETPSDALGAGVSRVSPPMGLRIFLGLIAAVVVTVIVVHLAGGGMGRH